MSRPSPSPSSPTLVGHAPPARRPPPQDRQPDDLAGATLADRYILARKIGVGATATVYRGWDTKRRRDIAVKVMHPHHGWNPRVVDTFVHEIRAAARMVHPNLVQLHGAGQDDEGHTFIVMELVRGKTLERLLEDGMPSIDWSIDVVMQVLDALDAAHDAGIVHRDAKPANVLIEGDLETLPPRARLCDFGVARIRQLGVDGSVPPETTHGHVWGTPAYMAPEQAEGRAVGPEADIYACSIMLYQLVTGALPFDADDPEEIADRQVHCEPLPPRQLRPDLDPALEAIILRGLAKAPEARFRNAQAMRSALFQLGRDAHGRKDTAPTIRFQRTSATDALFGTERVPAPLETDPPYASVTPRWTLGVGIAIAVGAIAWLVLAAL